MISYFNLQYINMKKSFVIIFIIFTLTQSFTCGKKEDAPTPPATTVEILVKDGNSWSTSNTALSVAGGATVYLYATEADVTNNTPKYTATTDQNGIAKVSVDFQSQYFLKAQKGDAKNMINGLLIIGIFQSQAEIDASPYQTPAPAAGSPRFLDTNRDDIITAQDKIIADRVEPKQDQNVNKTIIIY